MESIKGSGGARKGAGKKPINGKPVKVVIEYELYEAILPFCGKIRSGGFSRFINDAIREKLRKGAIDSDIKLTEEIILKFGFVNPFSKDCYTMHINGRGCLYFSIYDKNNHFYFHIGTEKSDILIKEIEYLHELQELYFILMGEVLEKNMQ